MSHFTRFTLYIKSVHFVTDLLIFTCTINKSNYSLVSYFNHFVLFLYFPNENAKKKPLQNLDISEIVEIKFKNYSTNSRHLIFDAYFLLVSFMILRESFPLLFTISHLLFYTQWLVCCSWNEIYIYRYSIRCVTLLEYNVGSVCDAVAYRMRIKEMHDVAIDY